MVSMNKIYYLKRFVCGLCGYILEYEMLESDPIKCPACQDKPVAAWGGIGKVE